MSTQTRTPIEELKGYLDILSVMEGRGRTSLADKGYKYTSIPGLLLAEGQWFTPIKRPPWMRKMPDKACFENATAMATMHKEYRYAEGYSFSLIPTLHAWLVDPDGNAVDPTWREPGAAYLGIIFPVEEVRANWQETGVFCMIDDWHNDWPLLKDGVPKKWRQNDSD
jgi:hypothetical protein